MSVDVLYQLLVQIVTESVDISPIEAQMRAVIYLKNQFLPTVLKSQE